MYVNIVIYNYYYLYGQRYKKKRKKKLEEKSTAAHFHSIFINFAQGHQIFTLRSKSPKILFLCMLKQFILEVSQNCHGK